MTQLPDTIEDLTQFVLVGKAKLQAYMLKLQTINKLSTAQEIRDQTLKEAQEISTALIAAEQRIGELLLAIPKQSGARTDLQTSSTRTEEVKTKSEVISEMGYSKDEASDYQRMAQNPEVVQKVIEDALANGEVVTKTAVMKEIKSLKEQLRAVNADLETERNKRNQDLREKLKLKEEIRELKQATMEGLDTKSLSENVFYFCSLANNFIGNAGGLVWLTDRIGDMPPREKELFMKAAQSIKDWATAFTTNLERRM